MCGNHILDLIRTVSIRGSPPRVREPPRVFRMKARIARITPACAGTTGSGWPCTRSPRDHPRVCGNHSASNSSRSSISGSPPRVREPQPIPHQSGQLPGITPACAGTTVIGCQHMLSPQDHPRVCGNHAVTLNATPSYLGSPPRVREPLYSSPSASRSLRITPACAGTTRQPDLLYRLDEDHPRVCGNHRPEDCQRMGDRGSPPRVREPPEFIVAVRHRAGITPACAGTTRRSSARIPIPEDHPRVCGNHRL